MNQHQPPAIGDRVTFSLENRIAPTEHYEGTVTEFHDIGIESWPTWTMNTNPPTAEDLPAVTVRTDRAGAWIVPIAWIREINRIADLPANPWEPWLFVGQYGTIESLDCAVLVSTDGMTEEDLDHLENTGSYPDGTPAVYVSDLLADAATLREFRALVASIVSAMAQYCEGGHDGECLDDVWSILAEAGYEDDLRTAPLCPAPLCPVGDLIGVPHPLSSVSVVAVPWDVMGDPRESVFVCDSCAQGEKG